MKQTAVEWLVEKLRIEFGFAFSNNILEQAKEKEEELKLEFVNKFVFDYTYNYRGNKTPYEYVDIWYKEYKRLEEQFKKK
jgi:hypothetical protein